MIEWDEINWRSAIGIILFALLVIAGSIFVVNDYLTSQRIKSELEGEIAKLNNFYASWKPLTQKDLDDMKAKRDSLQKEFDRLSPKIGLEVNIGKIEERIRQLADSIGVSLEKLELNPETPDGFLKVYPLVIAVKGSNEQISRFLIGLDNLGTAYRRGGAPVIASGRVELKLEFLSFDQQAWNNTYSCSVQVSPPELKEIDISQVKIFKDDLLGLKEKVDSEIPKLANSKKLMSEQCELEKQISALERQIKLSKSLAH